MKEVARAGGQRIVDWSAPWRAAARWWQRLGALRPGAAQRRTAAIWAERAAERAAAVVTAWSDSPIIEREYVNRTLGGDPDVNWVTHLRRQHLPERVARVLTIGCGSGPLERQGVDLDLAARFDAIDLSPGAIALARQLAARHGSGDRIAYRVADANRLELPAAAYDAIVFPQSLHHVERLEHLLAQVHHALRPAGRLVLNEYVGPTRFQWSDRQLGHAQRLLDRLPARLRRGIRSGEPKLRVLRPTIEQMIATDPSEAIRSAEILPLVRERFDVVEQIGFGGTILMPLLEDIAGNFDPARPDDVARLLALCAEERRLLDRGELPSDFVLLVARRRA
jgi:SAM-dependent methyltransferase